MNNSVNFFKKRAFHHRDSDILRLSELKELQIYRFYILILEINFKGLVHKIKLDKNQIHHIGRIK